MLNHPTVPRREFLAGVATAMTAIATRSIGAARQGSPNVRQAPPNVMYVGSFTGEGRGHGDGLSVFRRDHESAPWTRIQLLDKIADPSFVIVDRDARHLYSAHGGGTQATAYRIDEATGRLSVINQQSTGGENGVHLAIDATGKFLALANYGTGSLALFPITADGSLGERCDLAMMTGEPGPHRTQQTSSHPHHCPFDRAGRYIVVPDKGLDKVFVYRIDAERRRLVPASTPSIASRAGAAPRHADFHPTRPHAYVINELDSTITAYQLHPDTGELKPFQIMPTLPTSYTGNNSSAEVVTAPSGRFLYGSNRGHDSIAIFSIDQATGELTAAGWESTQGRTPRYFGLDPTGRALYAANQNSDNVVIFNVNESTGKLTPTREIVKVASPSTIAFR